jgi:glycine betaine/choline ABC-type transport system substrate-binding protein
MREMNYRAEALRQRPDQVARDFLAGRIPVS